MQFITPLSSYSMQIYQNQSTLLTYIIINHVLTLRTHDLQHHGWKQSPRSWRVLDLLRHPVARPPRGSGVNWYCGGGLSSHHSPIEYKDNKDVTGVKDSLITIMKEIATKVGRCGLAGYFMNQWLLHVAAAAGYKCIRIIQHSQHCSITERFMIHAL